jgi:hypothetical protein
LEREKFQRANLQSALDAEFTRTRSIKLVVRMLQVAPGAKQYLAGKDEFGDCEKCFQVEKDAAAAADTESDSDFDSDSDSEVASVTNKRKSHCGKYSCCSRKFSFEVFQSLCQDIAAGRTRAYRLPVKQSAERYIRYCLAWLCHLVRYSEGTAE